MSTMRCRVKVLPEVALSSQTKSFLEQRYEMYNGSADQAHVVVTTPTSTYTPNKRQLVVEVGSQSNTSPPYLLSNGWKCSVRTDTEINNGIMMLAERLLALFEGLQALNMLSMQVNGTDSKKLIKKIFGGDSAMMENKFTAPVVLVDARSIKEGSSSLLVSPEQGKLTINLCNEGDSQEGLAIFLKKGYEAPEILNGKQVTVGVKYQTHLTDVLEKALITLERAGFERVFELISIPKESIAEKASALCVGVTPEDLVRKLVP